MSPLSRPTLSPLPPLPKPPAAPHFPGTEQAAGASENSFVDLVAGQFQEVNGLQQNADGMVHQMLTGGDVNQAEVLTAVQKADLAFRMMMQVRNKLIDAYQQVQQIQI